MDTTKVNLILRVAKLYFELKMSQQEIAQQEKISKSTVSRLIKNAIDMGFVQTKIYQPKTGVADLEESIRQRFNLQKVVITADLTGNHDLLLNDVCASMAEDLPKYIEDNTCIGVAWGRTLNILGKHLTKHKNKDTLIFQINGSTSKMLYDSGSTDVIRAFKNAFGGEGYLMPVPAIVDSPKLAKMIMNESQIASVLNYGKHCDIAIFSIGNVENNAMLYELGILTPNEYHLLKEKKAVGDVCSHYIDINGNIADQSLDDRTIALSLAQIKKVSTKCVIVVGTEKLKPLLGVLKGGYVDILYLDDALARLILENTDSPDLP